MLTCNKKDKQQLESEKNGIMAFTASITEHLQPRKLLSFM